MLFVFVRLCNTLRVCKRLQGQLHQEDVSWKGSFFFLTFLPQNVLVNRAQVQQRRTKFNRPVMHNKQMLHQAIFQLCGISKTEHITLTNERYGSRTCLATLRNYYKKNETLYVKAYSQQRTLLITKKLKSHTTLITKHIINNAGAIFPTCFSRWTKTLTVDQNPLNFKGACAFKTWNCSA